MARPASSLVGAVLLVSSSAGCRKRRGASEQAATAPQAATNQEVIIGDWDARGKVAAVGADGGLIVQRGPAVEVFAPGGRSLGLLPIGDPEDTPGHGYAVSLGGTTVGFVVRDGTIELWDVATRARRSRTTATDVLVNGRTSTPFVGASPVGPTSWGPPRFLADGRLVTHHDGGIVVWKPDGTAAAVVVDDHLGIVRDSHPLADPDRLQLRCGSNSPGIANTSPFVVSLAAGRVVDRVSPDRATLRRFGGLEVWTSDDGVDGALWFAADGAVHRLVTGAAPDLVTATADGARVAWVERPGGDQPPVVKLLERATGRLLAPAGDAQALVALRFEGDRLVSVSEQGAVRVRPIAGLAAAAPVSLAVVQEDPRERTWQRSLVETGLGEFEAAAGMLAAVRQRDVPVKFQLGALYTWYLTPAKRDAADFRASGEALGIDFSAASTSEAMIVLAEDFARAQLPIASHFLSFWLQHPTPAGSATAERAVRLGSEVLLQLSEGDLTDERAVLLRRLAAAYPDHPVVREELEDQREREADQGRPTAASRHAAHRIASRRRRSRCSSATRPRRRGSTRIRSCSTGCAAPPPRLARRPRWLHTRSRCRPERWRRPLRTMTRAATRSMSLHQRRSALWSSGTAKVARRPAICT